MRIDPVRASRALSCALVPLLLASNACAEITVRVYRHLSAMFPLAATATSRSMTRDVGVRPDWQPSSASPTMTPS